MHEPKFYICPHCKAIAGLIRDAGVPLMCCGHRMERLVPGTAEASAEKHLPVAAVQNGRVRVTVGAVGHPMAPEHSIEWVYLLTDQGGQRKDLQPGAEPSVTFALADETPRAVYAYCNLHGLWKTDL